MDTFPADLRALRSTLLMLVMGALVLIGYLLFRTFADHGTPAVASRAVTPRGELAEDEKSTISLFKQSAPSVVFITRLGLQYDMQMRPFDIREGTGSGFIWDDAGDIVTNFHVIQGASGAKITLSTHETFDAELVGAAPEYDLAVLRIHAPKTKLPPILVGSSHDLQTGQKVFAIGNPFGLDQTLTTGNVSATGRSIRGVAGNMIEGAIQTDAAINPGNSGGPLLDSAGRLIGINTAIYSQSGSSAGIGFAVPVDTVNRIVPQLIASGRIVRPTLAITVANDSTNDLIFRRSGVQGVMILSVQSGSAAAKAGLRGASRIGSPGGVIGDIITEIDGKAVASARDLFDALGRYSVGNKIVVTVVRDGEIVKVPVTLDGGESGA